MSEIKTQTNGSIGYTGTVKVTVLKNGKPIKKTVKHNAGTYNLMKALAQSLLGKDMSADMPQFIDAYQGETFKEAKSSGRLLVRSRVITPHIIEPTKEGAIVPAECSVSFSAYIPFSSLRLGNSKPIVGLGLFSELKFDPQDIGLAEVQLVKPITLENSGYAALVEWILTLQNQSSQPTTSTESQSTSEESET